MMEIKKIPRPYDYKSLVEVYICTKRQDFPHQDFKDYYDALLKKLEDLFGISLSSEPTTFEGKLFGMVFNSTLRSLLKVSGPMDGYLESGLFWVRLEEKEGLDKIITDALGKISRATKDSQEAHREMLYALFQGIYGQISTVVTSQQLEDVGFNDLLEPEYHNYLEYL